MSADASATRPYLSAAVCDKAVLPFHFWILTSGFCLPALATSSARPDQLIRSAIQIKGIHAAKRLKIFLFVFFVSLWLKNLSQPFPKFRAGFCHIFRVQNHNRAAHYCTALPFEQSAEPADCYWVDLGVIFRQRFYG
jgi:hypothetical protein